MTAEPPETSPEVRKREFVEDWDTRAEQWDAWTPILDHWFGPASDRLLEHLQLRPGHRVLELAAGSGGFTRYLSRAVGADGRVVATDSGANMVKLAARNALAWGLRNVTARVMDGELPDLTWASMDAIASRQGVMFFGDPRAAFERHLRVVRPGGRLAVSVFTTPDRNGFLSVPSAVLSRWADPERKSVRPTEGPGPFSLGAPGQLEGLLAGVGFEDVAAETVPSPLVMPTLQDLLRFYKEIVGGAVDKLPLEGQSQAWAEVAQACSGFVGPGSSGAPAEILVASGARPLRGKTP